MIDRQFLMSMIFKLLLLVAIVSATIWMHREVQHDRREGEMARAAILRSIGRRSHEHATIVRKLDRIEAKLDRLLQEGRR